MTDLNHLLQEIERLDQEATKGPWEVWPQTDDEGVTYPEYIEGPKNDLFGARGWDDKHYIQEIPEMTMDDAEFIALARTALPQLAKALRAAMERHKPINIGGIDGGHLICEECYDLQEFGIWDPMPHPCQTWTDITDAMEGDHD